MTIREGARGPADLISQVIGSPRYVQPWYPDALTEAVLGLNIRDPIRISRWYFDDDVRVAVDFEPDPRDERFYLDEKRRWCREQKIVYVPIFLADQLSLDQFAERLAEAREQLQDGTLKSREQRALDMAAPEVAILQDPDVALYVDREAQRRVDEGLAAGHNWRGAARDSMLRRFKRETIAEIVQRYPRGAVGPEYRAFVAPHAAGG